MARKSDTTKVLLILGAVAGALVLACCGCGGILFFYLGNEFERQVQVAVTDNPVIVEHIGEITSFDCRWGASMEDPRENVFVFDISGTKGKGTLVAECITVDESSEEVHSGTLTTDSGEEYDLFPAEEGL